MLDQLLSIVKEHAQTTIVSNPDIPNERNEEAIAEVGNSIAGGLQSALASGQFKDVLQLLGGQGGDLSNNPLAGQLSGNAMQSLIDKFGLNQGQAGNIVSNLLPSVLQNFVSKTNDPGDHSLDIQGIFSSLTGGATNNVDLQGILGKLSQGGLDRDGDGDVDLNDVMNLVKGGASQQGGGGLMDMVKGLFGK